MEETCLPCIVTFSPLYFAETRKTWHHLLLPIWFNTTFFASLINTTRRSPSKGELRMIIEVICKTGNDDAKWKKLRLRSRTHGGTASSGARNRTPMLILRMDEVPLTQKKVLVDQAHQWNTSKMMLFLLPETTSELFDLMALSLRVSSFWKEDHCKTSTREIECLFFIHLIQDRNIWVQEGPPLSKETQLRASWFVPCLLRAASTLKMYRIHRYFFIQFENENVDKNQNSRPPTLYKGKNGKPI